MEALLALLFTFGLMYLLLIRPQQRRMRAHQAIVSALEPGDEVVTAGGIHGTITAVDDDAVRLEIAPGVVVRVQRGGVSQRVGPFQEADDEDDEDDYDEDDYDEDDGDDDEEDLDDDAEDVADEDVVDDDDDAVADDAADVEVVEVKVEEITVEDPKPKPNSDS